MNNAQLVPMIIDGINYLREVNVLSEDNRALNGISELKRILKLAQHGHAVPSVDVSLVKDLYNAAQENKKGKN